MQGKRRHAAGLATALLVLCLCGNCTAPLRSPKLGNLYSRAAQHHDETRNPVVVIPGILGSKLKQSGTERVVWGAFSGGYANPRTAEGARLVALPMREGAALRELTDDVTPNGVLDRVRVNLVGLPLELNAYTNILTTLGAGGYRDEPLGRSGAVDYGDEHFTCFQFDYDWRRDLVESAQRLHAFLLERKDYVRGELKRRYGTDNPDLRFDIVAHSMGGLVARYYLMYGNADLPVDGTAPRVTWRGAELIERVIIVGTPNAGSIKAFEQLVEGAEIAPIVPSYPPAVVGTMPSVYQLLPRARHGKLRSASADGRILDPLDAETWERFGWGLASIDQDSGLAKLLPDAPDRSTRHRIAIDHLRKCLDRARRFHEAIDASSTPPNHVRLHLFAGDAEDTPDVAVIDLRSGRIARVVTGSGDGTVPRSSALMDEREGGDWSPRLRSPIPWSGVTFLFRDHFGLTKDEAFSDNVLHLLLEADQTPRRLTATHP